MQNKRYSEGSDEEREMPSNLENIKKEESAPTKKFKSSMSELFQETNPANATENIPIPSPETNLSMDSTQASGGAESTDGFESEIDVVIQNYYESDTSVVIESHESSVNFYSDDTEIYDVNDHYGVKIESHECTVNCYNEDSKLYDVNDAFPYENKRFSESSDEEREMPSNLENIRKEESAPKQKFKSSTSELFQETNLANATENIPILSAETHLSVDSTQTSRSAHSTDSFEREIDVLIENHYESDTSVEEESAVNCYSDDTESYDGTEYCGIKIEGHECSVNCYSENTESYDGNEHCEIKIEGHECSVNCYSENTESYDGNEQCGIKKTFLFIYLTMKNKRSLESPDVAREMPSNLENFSKDENASSKKMKLSFTEIFKEENSANAIENIFLPTAETNLSMNNAGGSGAIGSTDDLLPAISVERPRDPRNQKFKEENSANAIENIFLPPAETNLSMNNAGASGAIGSTDDLLPAISVERPRDPRNKKFKEENSANATENIFLPSAETNLSMDNAGASGAIGSPDDLLPAISVERPRDPRNKKYLDERSRKWKWKNLIQNVKQNTTSDWV
ncbi:hypothetical protein CDAR_259151 [Caerostris darwini]|uniref:Uncharacterized protein n=1 Tax=Caerostris darwini TaxID=1538125 RepID=A0AAV4PTW2_9ARAC|nr:hypothetical protein CDAR_259151 [Caerostris darwini]